MVNQIVLAGYMIGLVEGLVYASKVGLDPCSQFKPSRLEVQVLQISLTLALGW